jgi:precorrin-2/cobalt-factor-2 C20-methyltransferase
MTDRNTGTLYGVGVGPGDPELLTIKALKALRKAEVIFAACSTKNDYSVAFDVVREHVSPETEVRALEFPMTRDSAELQAAWEINAHVVLDVLQTGRDAAFITIGDPLTYSTYGYLLRTVRQLAPDTPVETIPGITAYHAAAAKVNVPLVEGNESLTVVSGVGAPEEIRKLATDSANLVIMKSYRNFDGIMDALEALPEPRETYVVSRCGLPDEKVFKNPAGMRDGDMHYLSLVIARRPEPKGEQAEAARREEE